MGGHHHHIRPQEGVVPKEGQMGPVGPIHKKFSTVGVDHPADLGYIR